MNWIPNFHSAQNSTTHGSRTMIEDLNLLEQKVGGTLEDRGVGKDFLKKGP